MARIDIAAICGLDRTGKQHRMRRAGVAILAEIKRQASQTLNSSLPAYQRALRLTHASDDSVGIELVGAVPNMVEQGMGPGGIGSVGAYDMRRFLLKAGTKSLKVSKKGNLYLNVPFKPSAGQVQRAGATQAAQALAPTLTRPSGSTLWGGRLGPSWGRLAGMVRKQKTYSRATQSSYGLWRTISQGGGPWMHPGVKARRIFDRVRERLPEILSEVL